MYSIDKSLQAERTVVHNDHRQQRGLELRTVVQYAVRSHSSLFVICSTSHTAAAVLHTPVIIWAIALCFDNVPNAQLFDTRERS